MWLRTLLRKYKNRRRGTENGIITEKISEIAKKPSILSLKQRFQQIVNLSNGNEYPQKKRVDHCRSCIGVHCDPT